MPKSWTLFILTMVVLGCGTQAIEEPTLTLPAGSDAAAEDYLPGVSKYEANLSPSAELTGTCGPSNFVVPCGSGYCPRNSVCIRNAYCQCLFGFSYNKCSGEPCSGSGCPNNSWWCEDCQALCQGRTNRSYCISVISRPSTCGDMQVVNTCPFSVNAWFHKCLGSSAICTIIHNMKPHEVRTISNANGSYIACQ